MNETKPTKVTRPDVITDAILSLRGQKVLLDTTLASLYRVAVDVEIMRAFVQLRSMLAAHAELATRIDALEQRYDGQFRTVFQAIRQLIEPAPVPRRRIGFRKT